MNPRSTGSSRADFVPAVVRMQATAPSPLPRATLWTLAALVVIVVMWAMFARLDVIAVAHGRLVPEQFVQIVQPAEGGVVRELRVHEGDRVTPGQVLVRMDRRIAEAERSAVDGELATRRLQMLRIDAELAPGAGVRGYAPSPSAVAPQLRAHRDAHRDAVAAERAGRDKAASDLDVAEAVRVGMQRSLPLQREQAAAWEQLAREGFAGKLLVLDHRRALLEAEQQLVAQEATVASLRAGAREASERVARLESAYREQLHDERVRAQADIQRLEQDSAKLAVRQASLELRAPTAGLVKDLATHSVGSVVQPGTVLMTVVPTGESMLAEVWIEQADAGFVRLDQPVRLKISGFPFQRYGTLVGHLRHVSADASERGAAPAMGGAMDPAIGRTGFRALVAIGSGWIERDGQRFPLSAGMEVSAEIRLGTRTVMEYLLSPLAAVAGEAGREH